MLRPNYKLIVKNIFTGNEGFIVTNFATNEDPREKNNTPREVDENFLRRYHFTHNLQVNLTNKNKDKKNKSLFFLFLI